MKYVFIDPLYEAHIHRSNQISFRNMERIAQKKDIEEMKKLEVFRHKCRIFFWNVTLNTQPYLFISNSLNSMDPFFD